MDIIIGILIAILFLVGNAGKKKKEREQREARARTMQQPASVDPRFPPAQPHSDDPRFPSGPYMQKSVSEDFEGEPVQELPVRPAPVQQRMQTYERSNPQTEGGPAAMGSVKMPTATVAAHMEATQGRHATLLSGSNVHAHTEGSMGGERPARRAVLAHGTKELETPRGVSLEVLTRLGHDPNAVAEGIILSEILGKPKALRRV